MKGIHHSIAMLSGLVLCANGVARCGQSPAFSDIDRKQLVLDVSSQAPQTGRAAASADATAAGSASSNTNTNAETTAGGILAVNDDAVISKNLDTATATTASGDGAAQAASGNGANSTGDATDKGKDANNNGNGGSAGKAGQPSGEAVLCAAHFGVPVEQVIVTGDKQSETLAIAQSSIVAIKLAGDRTSLELMLQSTDELRIHGLCLFLTGNQTSAIIHIASPLDGVVYYGRGHETSGQIDVTAGGSIAGLYADLRGDQAMLTVAGVVQDVCDHVTLKGNHPQFSCQ